MQSVSDRRKHTHEMYSNYCVVLLYIWELFVATSGAAWERASLLLNVHFVTLAILERARGKKQHDKATSRRTTPRRWLARCGCVWGCVGVGGANPRPNREGVNHVQPSPARGRCPRAGERAGVGCCWQACPVRRARARPGNRTAQPPPGADDPSVCFSCCAPPPSHPVLVAPRRSAASARR